MFFLVWVVVYHTELWLELKEVHLCTEIPKVQQQPNTGPWDQLDVLISEFDSLLPLPRAEHPTSPYSLVSNRQSNSESEMSPSTLAESYEVR